MNRLTNLKKKRIEYFLKRKGFDNMEEWKLLVVFDFENGSHTITDYNELEDLAKRLNRDFYDLLSDLAKSLKAESCTIMSSRLLE